jgi:glucosyl-3-phosphoglycerate synthase
MADFYQHARVPTLHHLAHADSAAREQEMLAWEEKKPVALLLPALYAECERPALPRILEEVSQACHISEVVLSMNGMNAAEHDRALLFCRQNLKGKRAHILWNDGPRLTQVYQRMADAGLPGAHAGKGSNIWMGIAWLKARGFKGVVVSHDTDILNYSRDLLWRLCYPLLHPGMGYRFAKGYYSRVSDRLFGRVTRLLIFPLIQACRDVLGAKPLIEQLESYRYPLSGEFAADMDALQDFSLPGGWGLEIALLCEAFRHLPGEHQCQVDLGFHFEHRHRSLSHEEVGVNEPGLITAAADVARCLAFQVLRESEPRSAEGFMSLIIERYRSRAQEWLSRYEHVALLNGLRHDAEEEGAAVTAFGQALDRLLQNLPTEGLRVPALRETPAKTFAQIPGLAEEIAGCATEVC